MNLVINLDKPKGITSQDAVTLVKRILKVKKAGHAGTLDPLATGVLLVCTGEATKIAGYLSDLEKEYTATIKLGERTDTYDAEGKIVERVKNFTVSHPQVEEALERFKGEIRQLPPAFSALKVSGRPMYELARKGIEVERTPRTVTVRSISLTRFEPPLIEIDVACSKGTYIRSLAEDIGMALGTGAHITELRRTRIGDFSAADSASPEELPQKERALRSIDSALGHLREIILTERDFKLASHGTTIWCKGDFSDGEKLRLKAPDGRLFALGVVLNGKIKIERLLHIRP